MVHPKGCWLLHQAVMDAILNHPDCLLYLPVGFAAANGDVVVDNAKPLAEPCKAVCKFSTIVCLDIAYLTPTGNQVIMQELSSPPAV